MRRITITPTGPSKTRSDWWKAVCTSTRDLMQGIDKNQVVALSFSAHMMACLCVDKSGRPLRPCIIWADMRATEQADALSRRIDPHRFYGITGHRISSSYTLEKLMWVQKNEPDVYKATYKTLNPKDYIAFCLTGAPMVTDYSDASGTNAFDLNTFCWSGEILQAAGIDMEKFPDAKPSTYVVGEVSRQAAEGVRPCAGHEGRHWRGRRLQRVCGRRRRVAREKLLQPGDVRLGGHDDGPHPSRRGDAPDKLGARRSRADRLPGADAGPPARR